MIRSAHTKLTEVCYLSIMVNRHNLFMSVELFVSIEASCYSYVADSNTCSSLCVYKVNYDRYL